MPPHRSHTSSLRPAGPSFRYAPRRCDPNLYWSHCQSREGCSYHHDSEFLEPFSTYRSSYDDQYRFRDEAEIDWDEDNDSDSDTDMDECPFNSDSECPDPDEDPFGNFEWMVYQGYYVFQERKRSEPTPSSRVWDPKSSTPRPKFPHERDPHGLPWWKQTPPLSRPPQSTIQHTTSTIPGASDETVNPIEIEANPIDCQDPAGKFDPNRRQDHGSSSRTPLCTTETGSIPGPSLRTTGNSSSNCSTEEQPLSSPPQYDRQSTPLGTPPYRMEVNLTRAQAL
jgi:hypothetical protein